MKLGISSYTFGWALSAQNPQPFDENNLLDWARELGVSLLQIGDNLPLHEFSPQRLHALKDRAGELNVELEIGARGLTRERIATYAQIARVLAAKILRFVIDADGYEPSPEEVVAVLRDSLPLLRHTILGIENHDRFGAATLARLVESVGSERVGICLDTANSLGAGEGLNEVLRVLAPHAVNLHLKDFTIKRVPSLMGFIVEGAVAGQGMAAFGEALETVAGYRRCRTAILETWVPPLPDFCATLEKEARWARESLHYLRRFAWE